MILNAKKRLYITKCQKLGICRSCHAPAITKDYCIKHRDYYNQKALAYVTRCRLQVLNHYGAKCNCCNEDQLGFLTIDHINNDGAKQRKELNYSHIYPWIIRNHYPNTLQILCMNCNWGKRWNKGECPHKQKVPSGV